MNKLRKGTEPTRRPIRQLLLLLLLVLLLGIDGVYAQTDDPCKVYADTEQLQCIECKVDHTLALLADDQVFCATKLSSGLCTLDIFYTNRAIDPIIDPGNLQFYTLDNGQEYCYSCNAPNAAFQGCRRCGDTFITPSLENASEVNALKMSVGCAVCETDYFPQIEPHAVLEGLNRRDCVQREEDPTPKAGQLCGWSAVWQYDPEFNEELLRHDGSLICSECSDVIPGCSWCSSGYSCLKCESDAFEVTSLTSYNNELTCFYNYCGPGKGVSSSGTMCEDCQIDLCQECKIDNGDETCLLCEMGYALSSDATQCLDIETGSSKSIELYVLAEYNGYYVSDLSLQKNIQPTHGESLAEHYGFIQQALSHTATVKLPGTLNLVETVHVTIYLGKGTHFFFACVESLHADLSNWAGTVTDFCEEIETLKFNYAKTDNMKLTVKPLDCGLDNAATQADSALFNAHCVNMVETEDHTPTQPIIAVNSAFVNFNVTNEATFENIDFEGNDNLAFYLEAPNVGKPIQELPYPFCKQTFASESHHGFEVKKVASVPFSYHCKRPEDLTNGVDESYPSTKDRCSDSLSNFVKGHCFGEPYSPGFFEISDGVMAQRRRVLFNLYAFDELHTVDPKTPSLTLKGCKFQNFMSGQMEALIQVETNNLYPPHGEQGQWRHMGADNGAKILIEDSVFEYSRFCKGLIVYREGVDYQATHAGILSYQKECGDFNDEVCADCSIVLRNSNFTHLNHGTQVRALRPFMDSLPTVRNSTKLDSWHSGGSSVAKAGAFAAPIFSNFAAVLNLQDFKGVVEVRGCRMNQNIINIPDHFEPVRSLDRASVQLDQENLNYFHNGATGLYEMAVCEVDAAQARDVYLLRDGISPYLNQHFSLASLFNEFERQSGAVYISRPTKPVIFIGNTFEENIGLFGGAVSINSPNFAHLDDPGAIKDQPYVLFYKNDFARNMAYISGNALFMQGTKRSDRPLDSCSMSVLIDSNDFVENFGFKHSDGGAVSLTCSEVIDSNRADYLRSSGREADYSNADYKLDSEILDGLDSAEGRDFRPYFRTAHIYRNTFELNHAGRKGSAIFIQGLTAVRIEGSTFVRNKAVDSLQERLLAPAYAKYILEQDGSQDEYRAFSFSVEPGEVYSCGRTEIEYLARCADSKSLIPQSFLEGAVYLEGGHSMNCDSSECTEEKYEIISSTFEENEINYDYQWPSTESLSEDYSQAPQTSVLCIKDVRDVLVYDSTFANHAKSPHLKDWLIERQLQSFADQFPEEYFDYSHSPMIQISQGDDVGLGFLYKVSISKNYFSKNLNFQKLGFGSSAYYRGSLIHVESEDQIVNNMFIFKLNRVLSNKAIGPETSLIYMQGCKYVQIQGNSQILYNGHVSTREFAPPSFAFTPKERVSASEQINLLFAQEYGVFYFDLVEEIQTQGNSFMWCGAVYGTAFYNLNSAFRSQFNTYQYMVAMSGGSVMRQVGVGIRSAITDETVQNTLGVAYDLEGGRLDQEQVSMYYFKRLTMFNCAGEDAGYFRLLRSGGIQCNQCALSMDSDYGREKHLTKYLSGESAPDARLTVFAEDYPRARLVAGVNMVGPVSVYDSRYTGGQLNFTIGDESFQASPKTRPLYLWFKNCKFERLRGGLSGAFYVEQSDVYFSNTDQSLTRRMLASEDDDREAGRRLQRSSFVAQDNVGSLGSGFVYGTTQSNIVFKGQNLQSNEGREGGVIALRQSTLHVENTVAEGHKAESYGGFLAAIDSQFYIESTLIGKASGGSKSCAIFALGEPAQRSSVNKLSYVGIDNNSCDQDLLQIVNSELELDTVRFRDNEVSSGTNGITAVNSKLSLRKLTVTASGEVDKDQITAGVGFLSLFEGSEVDVTSCTFQRTSGLNSGLIYSRGKNRISIQDSTFVGAVTQSPSGALIDVDQAVSLQIASLASKTEFSKNLGAPVIKARNTNILLSNIDFEQTDDANFIDARATDLEIRYCKFFGGGDFDQLGGALYWQGHSLLIFGATFQSNKAASGGAIYLIGETPGKIDITSTTFLQNEAQQGGALAIISADEMLIQRDKFRFNKAKAITPMTVAAANLPSNKAQGGAIYSLCLEAYNQECAVKLVGNVFENNVADDAGGATIWLNKPFIETETSDEDGGTDADDAGAVNPEESASKEEVDNGSGQGGDDADGSETATDGDSGDPCDAAGSSRAQSCNDNASGGPAENPVSPENIYIDNNATYENEYGHASNVKLLIFNSISNNDPAIEDESLQMQALKFDEFNVVSGIKIAFKILISDQNRVVISTDNSTTASMIVLSTEPGKEASLLQNNVFAVNGVLDFSGLTIVADPGYSLKLQLIINLESQIDGTNVIQQKQEIKVNVRECVPGEKFTEKNTCEVCPLGTYLITANRAPRECKACEPNSVCLGGNNIAPDKAYWRANSQTTEFHRCLNPDACLAGDLNHPEYSCKDQYEGPLCSGCKGNYYLAGADFICYDCYVEDMKVRFISLTIFLLLSLAAFIALISMINSLVEIRPLNFVPAGVKMCAMHLQLVFLFQRIQQKSLNEQPISDVIVTAQTALQQEYLHVTRCLLSDKNTSKGWITGEKVLWITMPLSLIVLAGVFIFITLSIQKRRNSAWKKLVQICFLTYWFLHIELAYQILSSFDCIEFLGETVYHADLSRQCFSSADDESSDHLKFTLSVILPFGLFWLIITPLAQTAISLMQREKIELLINCQWKISTLDLDQQQIVQRTQDIFGFSINGLRNGLQMWDQILIGRNIILVTVYVMLHAIGWPQEFIILGLIIYLVPFLVLQVLVRPYSEKWLNWLDIMGQAVILCYLLTELIEDMRYKNYEREQESASISVIFVLVPTFVYLFFMFRFLRTQILILTFYRSHLLFKILSCGCNSVVNFAHNRVVAEEEKELSQTPRSNQHSKDTNSVIDHQTILVNCKRATTIRSKGQAGKIKRGLTSRAVKKSRTQNIGNSKQYWSTPIKFEETRQTKDLVQETEQDSFDITSLDSPKKYQTAQFLKEKTMITQLETQGDNIEEDDVLMTFANKQNKLISSGYRGENIISDKLLQKKLDFVSLPNIHAKGTRNLNKLILEEPPLESAQTDQNAEKNDENVSLSDILSPTRHMSQVDKITSMAAQASKEQANFAQNQSVTNKFPPGRIQKRSSTRMPMIDEQTDSVVLGNFLMRQSSGLGRVNDRSEQSHVVAEMMEDDESYSVTQLENVQATPEARNEDDQRRLSSLPQALNGIIARSPLNQDTVPTAPKSDPFRLNNVFSNSTRFGDNVKMQNLILAQAQITAAQPPFHAETIMSEEQIEPISAKNQNDGQSDNLAVVSRKSTQKVSRNVFDSDEQDCSEPVSFENKPHQTDGDGGGGKDEVL